LIHDLLDLIMTDLLKTDSADRIDACELNKRMVKLVNAASDEIYLLKAVPRTPSPSRDNAGQKSSNGKKVRFETWPLNRLKHP